MVALKDAFVLHFELAHQMRQEHVHLHYKKFPQKKPGTFGAWSTERKNVKQPLE